MATISRRLDRLEQTSGAWSDIERLIENHKYYDTLTDKQKRRYCAMVGVLQRDFEEIALSLFGDLHLLLMKFDPPRGEEVAEIKAEITAGTFKN